MKNSERLVHAFIGVLNRSNQGGHHGTVGASILQNDESGPLSSSSPS